MNEPELILDVEVPEDDLQSGALKILNELRPEWKTEDIKFMKMTEGVTNKMVGAYHKSDTKKNNAVVIRVFGHKTDLIIDRDIERLNLKLLNAANLASEYYGRFRNGICYAFVPGRSLDKEDSSDPHISKLIATKLAEMHCTDTSNYPISKDVCIWERIENYFKLVPDSFSCKVKNNRYLKTIPSKDKLMQEYQEIKPKLMSVVSSAEYCHNDLLLSNVIYCKDSDKVTFIDYEYGAYNYAGFDIGSHFNQFEAHNLYPNKDFQFKWIRNYLEAKYDAKGIPKGNITETDIEMLYIQANTFSLLAHFFWGIWALIQARFSLIDLDYIEYSNRCLSKYFSKKDQLLALIPHCNQ